ncbi:MAG: TrkH family potassium uptake protein [Proteobacteria bacterium]|nr:TrkH family potassium uptake protein [Pseudomonadota bacterium]MBU4010302.1 TrkH family potassium uptake protein [Pseudomonadota bacterium]
MNYKLVLKIISILTLIITFFLIFPAAVALYYKEINEFKIFLLIIGGLLLISSISYFFLKPEKQESLSARDGFLLVTLSWLSASFVGALPFYFTGSIPAFTNAFFETMSGFTTTGASILTNIESLPKSLLFWRSLTHWLGGMGIVVLTVAILPILGIGGLQLIKAEAPGPSVDKISPRIKETAKILWYIYLGLTITQTLLLMLGGMNLFDAVTHTFGTLATGGFSPKNTSVGYYNSAYIDGVITIFMIIAGANFILHYRVLTGRYKVLFWDTEFRVYLTIFILAVVIITFNLYGTYYDSIGNSIRHASFQAASILTTTGYATVDYEKWPFLAQAILFFLMFIGGCSGSTGGGIKVIRIYSLLKQAYNEMKYLLHPRAIFILKINRKTIKKDIMYAISGFFFLYIFMILITTLVVASSNQDVLTSVTTALATVGNIGPGLGNVGPAEHYAFYPAYVKWVLCFAMLAGRLELYTIFILFTPAFWRK